MPKKRANGEGSIRKRSDGRWEGRYTAGHEPESGRPIYKNVLGKTQAEVKEKLRQAIEASRALDVTRSGAYTVEEWLNTWYELYSKPYVRESTAQYYKRFIDLHIGPAIGDIPLGKLTARDVQKLYNDRRTTAGSGPPRSRSSRASAAPRCTACTCHNCLDRAVKERLILRNPTEDCRIPKLEKKEMHILRPEHIGAYLKAAEARDALPMFYLALTSGVRKGELVALLWSDVDTERCTVSVSKQATVSGGEIKVTRPKTATSVRRVSVPRQTVELLIQEHGRHPDNPYLFPSPKTGGMYYPDSVVKLHKKIFKDAGLEPIRLHDLRHTFATLALQSGVDVKTVSSMLGHYDAGFTLSTYAHATERMQEEAAEKMGSLMSQVM